MSLNSKLIVRGVGLVVISYFKIAFDSDHLPG